MAEKFPYEDIINLPPHISSKHPQPTMLERAARFAPFAAITGYEEMVLEEARVTQERTELSEGETAMLNEKLKLLYRNLDAFPEVTITCFRQDLRKSGGAYVALTGIVRKMDVHRRMLLLDSGDAVLFRDIYRLESTLFDAFETE